VRFSRKRQDGFAPNFFLGFRRKHLFITTCIEKHCTRPFRISKILFVICCFSSLLMVNFEELFAYLCIRSLRFN